MRKNELRRRRNVVEKSQIQSKKFDEIDIELVAYIVLSNGSRLNVTD